MSQINTQMAVADPLDDVIVNATGGSIVSSIKLRLMAAGGGPTLVDATEMVTPLAAVTGFERTGCETPRSDT